MLGTINYTYRNSLRYVYRIYYYRENDNFSIYRAALIYNISNQIKSLLLSHHHSTSALVSEILMSVLQTVQKNNRQFTYGQTVQKKKKKQFTYGQTV